MRVKEMITKEERVDVSANSPNCYHKKFMGNGEENMHADIGA